MDTGRITVAAVRRCIALACLVIVFLFIGFQVRAPGVFFTRFDVVLLPPTDAVTPNSLTRSASALSATAAVITMRFNGGPITAAPASHEITLVGEGVRDGHAVRLRNYGGQWAPDFSRPVIDVQVVGPSEDTVQERALAISEELAQLLAEEQSRFRVDQRFRVTTTLAANEPVVGYHGAAVSRATAAALVLGVSLTGTALLRTSRRTPRGLRHPETGECDL